jgi:phenylacetate-coenzyme A ligase PaaK-like adenylate-forming protein
MVDHLIQKSKHPMSGYYLNNKQQIQQLVDDYKDEKKILMIGVSYALLDLADTAVDLNGITVMETGGMKGRRKEMTKAELHSRLQTAFNLPHIHSEYGMTELLSQAYSSSNQTFECPPWMKILLRDRTDPFHLKSGKSGAINVIDLANIFSCSFIETEDLGRFNPNGFEVLGRLDQADIRGCNLLVQ